MDIGNNGRTPSVTIFINNYYPQIIFIHFNLVLCMYPHLDIDLLQQHVPT